MQHETFLHNGIVCTLWTDPSLPYIRGDVHDIGADGRTWSSSLQASARDGDDRAIERAREYLCKMADRLLIAQGR